ncbi:MAG: glycosyltransferase family 2 protein [Paludibacter sp.]|nr:glycosyltransferase family 2 protein [Paludibacter sp.]
MLHVSIVIYKHLFSEMESLINSLLESEIVEKIYIIDNSPVPSCDFKHERLTYIFTGKNIGYGAAHNIALRKTIVAGVPYHLVVNPDITMNAHILKEMVDYLEQNKEIGHLMPKVVYPSGEIQYLCKLIPTPLDLIFRRFLPKKWIEKRINRFEMRNSGYNKIMDVPYLSGCFMLLRTEALKKAGLFDERFFLYPEDIDLTRRIGAYYRTVFYPLVSVVHHHAQESYKSLYMMLVHSWNLKKYFNKWGWIFDKQRKKINQQYIKQYNL